MSAPTPPAPASPASDHALDPPALQRQLHRLLQAEAPPWLHLEVSRRMAERLALIKLQPATVLQWSAYLGGSSADLLAAYPQARQYGVEPSAAAAQRSTAAHKRAWWEVWRRPAIELLRVESILPGSTELLWANMALHASRDLPATLAAWHRALAVDGFLMFSCLGPDSLVELRALYAAAGWGAPMPQWHDMHDIGDLLVEAGFADPVMDQERLTLTWADSAALLADLRALGGNVAPRRFAACRGRGWYAQLQRQLEGLRNAQGRLALSVEIVYGHAVKPVPRAKLSAQTHVSLDEMRSMVRQGRKIRPNE